MFGVCLLPPFKSACIQYFFHNDTAKTVFLPITWPMTDTIELPTRVQVVFSVEIGYCIGGWIMFTLAFSGRFSKKKQPPWNSVSSLSRLTIWCSETVLFSSWPLTYLVPIHHVDHSTVINCHVPIRLRETTAKFQEIGVTAKKSWAKFIDIWLSWRNHCV